MELIDASWAKILTEAFPEKVAEIMIEVYGSEALEATRDFGLTAYVDERPDDYLYWVIVFHKILEREDPPEKDEA